MQFSILAFVGLASAAAVTPRASQYGAWDVSFVKTSAANGFNSRTLTATYTNTELSEPIKTQCTYKYEPWADPKETSSCDNASFSYEYDGTSLKLNQVVGLWGEQVTVMGEGPIETTCDSASGRACHGETQIEVSSAIA